MSKSKLIFIENVKGVNRVSDMIIHNFFKYLYFIVDRKFLLEFFPIMFLIIFQFFYVIFIYFELITVIVNFHISQI